MNHHSKNKILKLDIRYYHNKNLKLLTWLSGLKKKTFGFDRTLWMCSGLALSITSKLTFFEFRVKVLFSKYFESCGVDAWYLRPTVSFDKLSRIPT